METGRHTSEGTFDDLEVGNVTEEISVSRGVWVSPLLLCGLYLVGRGAAYAVEWAGFAHSNHLNFVLCITRRCLIRLAHFRAVLGGNERGESVQEWLGSNVEFGAI